MTPRVLRFRDAPSYLGMDRNRFNAEVRPFVTEISIGKQGIGFDRIELDAWFDDYKSRNGRPARRKFSWDERQPQDSLNAERPGTSTNTSSASAFAKALERATSGKRNAISKRLSASGAN